MYQANNLQSQTLPSGTPPAPTPGPPPVKKTNGCLVGFLGFMLAVSLLTSVALINTRLTIFSSTFWQNWLDTTDAYEKVQDVLLPNLLSLTSEGTGTMVSEGFGTSTVTTNSGVYSEEMDSYTSISDSGMEAGLDQVVSETEGVEFSPQVENEIGELLQKAVSAQWLQEQSENAIDSFFRWAYGQDEHLMIVFDLKPLQGTFTEGFFDIAQMQFEELPPCPASIDIETYDFDTMNCQPPGVDFDSMRDEFVNQNPAEVGYGTFPDEYVIDEAAFLQLWQSGDGQLTGATQDVSSLFADPPRMYQVLMILMIVSIGFTALFAGLIILVYRRNLKGSLRAIGIAILVPSLIILIFCMLIYFGSGSLDLYMNTSPAWTYGDDLGMSADTMSSQSVLVTDFVIPLLGEFIKAMIFNVIIMSAVILIGAIVMLVLAKVLRGKKVVGYYQDQNQPR